MGNRLFIGNLSYTTNEDELKATFAKCGSVTSVKIILDRETQRSRGFGFVEFTSDSEAAGAIEALDGSLLGGRPLAVKEAEARPPRQQGGGGGGYTSRPSGGGGGGYTAPAPVYNELPPTGGRKGGKKRDRDRSDRDYD
jgi:cold-inducible RNA-binding protein